MLSWANNDSFIQILDPHCKNIPSETRLAFVNGGPQKVDSSLNRKTRVVASDSVQLKARQGISNENTSSHRNSKNYRKFKTSLFTCDCYARLYRVGYNGLTAVVCPFVCLTLIPGSKLTFSTNLFHHSLLAPTSATWTAFSDYWPTGLDLLCSTVFHF